MPPAKRFNESISQKQEEESLPQAVSGVYDHSNVFDDAIQDENRNPYVRDPGAQNLGTEKVELAPSDVAQMRTFPGKRDCMCGYTVL